MLQTECLDIAKKFFLRNLEDVYLQLFVFLKCKILNKQTTEPARKNSKYWNDMK